MAELQVSRPSYYFPHRVAQKKTSKRKKTQLAEKQHEGVR